ncbi:MAG: hypothetical protein QOG53_2193 [Frankiales bacterium]|jgi:hypothetical protein|nr:hypothetical protein [Frankiales bacterium]
MCQADTQRVAVHYIRAMTRTQGRVIMLAFSLAATGYGVWLAIHADVSSTVRAVGLGAGVVALIGGVTVQSRHERARSGGRRAPVSEASIVAAGLVGGGLSFFDRDATSFCVAYLLGSFILGGVLRALLGRPAASAPSPE